MRRYLAILLALAMLFTTVSTDIVLADEAGTAYGAEYQTENTEPGLSVDTADENGDAGVPDPTTFEQSEGQADLDEVGVGEAGEDEGDVVDVNSDETDASQGTIDGENTDALAESSSNVNTEDAAEEGEEGNDAAEKHLTENDGAYPETQEDSEGDLQEDSRDESVGSPTENILKTDEKTAGEEADSEEKAVAFSYEETVDGYVISLSADPEVLPEDVTVKIKKVETLDGTKVQKLVENELAEGQRIQKIVTFDITFLDKDGKEIEPEDGSVSVSIKLANDMVETLDELESVDASDAENKATSGNHTDNLRDADADAQTSVSVEIYHIDDDKNVEQVDSNVNEDNEVVFDAEEFSLYSVVLLTGPIRNSFADAAVINVNTEYSGSIIEGDVSNYYKFTLDRPGYVNFIFSHEFVDDGQTYWDLLLYSSADLDNELLTRSYIGNKNGDVTSYGTGLPSGNYFIVIKASVYWRWNSADYNFRINFEPSNYYEEESNDSITTASEISLNKEYHGNIMNNNDKDWYRVTLNSPGYISFRFSHDFVDDGQTYWDLRLYAQSDLNTSLLERSYTGNSVYAELSEGTGLPAGTYYLLITDSVYWRWDPCTYNITVSYTPSNDYEREWNNIVSQANPITLNKIYSGNTMSDNDNDYYRFILQQSGNISFTFSHDFVDDDGSYWELNLYDSRDLNTSKYSQEYIGNNRNTENSNNMYLTAGTYYVRISVPYYWRCSPNKYHFRVNTPIDVSVSVNPVSVGGKSTLKVSGNQAGILSFSSSDTSIATVDNSGTITGKKPGAVTIKVRAAATANSAQIVKDFQIKVVNLSVPGSISLSNTSNGVKIKYGKVPGATKYLVYRDGKRIATVTGTSYTDKSNLKNGSKHKYKVAAANDSIKSKASSLVVIYRMSQGKISSARNSGSGKMTVKWKANSKATGYRVQYSTTSDFSGGKKTITVKGKNSTSKTVKGLGWGNTYYVRVQSYRTVGGKKYYSAWSGTKKVKIKK